MSRQRPEHYYEFGAYRLEAAEGRLPHAGQEIPLTPKAFQLLQMLVENSGHVLVARVYAGLGDNDRAFASLDKAYEEHTPFLWEIRVMPQFDRIRSDPRYSALLRRMNLPL